MKVISSNKKSLIIFTFLFLFVFFVGFSSLLINKYSLIWQVDSLGQYYPSFIYIGHYIQNFLKGLLSGQWVLPTFDLSIGMGEDIIGTLNYYGFGDPLNLIAVFVTKNNSAFLFSFMIILRMWLSGISLICYLRYLKISNFPSMLSALCYTFSGFSLYGGINYIEWFSVLIYTPLILLGIEKILFEKKYVTFCLAICYAGLCGFYFLFMVSLLLAVYLPVRLIFKEYNIYQIFLNIIKIFSLYVLGLLLSAPFFFPSVQSYLNSERSSASITEIIFNKNNYIPKFNFNIIDYLFSNFYDNSPYLSGITIIQLLCIISLFFVTKSKRKNQCIIFLILGLFATSIPITGYLFNGFGQSNTRWYFILHILFCGILAFVLNNLFTKKAKFKLSKRGNKIYILLISLISISIVTNISVNVLTSFSQKSSVMRSVGNNKNDSDWHLEFIKFKDVELYTSSPFQHEIDSRNQLFRTSNAMLTNINGRPDNLAMLNHYYGLNYWFSIINNNTQTLVNAHNDGSLRWRSYGFADNIVLNSLYGVKYLMTPELLKNTTDYKLKKSTVFNNTTWYLYENKSFLGFSYLVEKDSINTFNTNVSKQVFDKQMQILYSNAKKDSTITKYETDKFHISTNSNSSDTLVLPVPYSKYWTAKVDNKNVNINKNNRIYMSVDLEKGPHIIEFDYNNSLITFGMILSLTSFIILLYINKKAPKISL